MVDLIQIDVPIYICETIYIGNYSYYPETKLFHWQSRVTGEEWTSTTITYDEIVDHLHRIYEKSL